MEPVNTVTKDEVRDMIGHAMVSLKGELKDYIGENCKGHREHFYTACESLRNAAAQHEISINQLKQLADSDRNAIGLKLDALANIVQRLCVIIEDNGKTGMATRLRMAEAEIETLKNDSGERQRGWRDVLVQSLPVFLTWAGFLVFWVIYMVAQNGARGVLP